MHDCAARPLIRNGGVAFGVVDHHRQPREPRIFVLRRGAGVREVRLDAVEHDGLVRRRAERLSQERLAGATRLAA